jgi:hypothetical protein
LSKQNGPGCTRSSSAPYGRLEIGAISNLQVARPRLDIEVLFFLRRALVVERGDSPRTTAHYARQILRHQEWSGLCGQGLPDASPAPSRGHWSVISSGALRKRGEQALKTANGEVWHHVPGSGCCDIPTRHLERMRFVVPGRRKSPGPNAILACRGSWTSSSISTPRACAV